MKTSIKTVNDYIETFPKSQQQLLKQMRATIQQAAPNAVESISYGMAAYKLNGKPLVYFAGFENHIGFYATPNTHIQFARQLAKYKQGKGSVQFPINKALPLTLVTKMVKFKVKQLQQKTTNKKINQK
jgi:uncharacterized protein YdhG (YjbR/CyaY superfamily)